MVQIKPFKVEEWMDKFETTPGVVNVAETCPSMTCLEGERLSAEDVIITQGAIGANFLTLYTLLGPGDHVVCVYPTYQQLYDVPRSLGADVSLWKLRTEDGFVPDVEEMEILIKENTKAHLGERAPIPTNTLHSIAKVAQVRGIILFSDEVYRLFSTAELRGSAMCRHRQRHLGYKRTVVTGFMSKGFALAGIRVGWVATKDKTILLDIASARDYNTISVSQVDDQIASYALSPAVQEPLVARNMALARTNAKLLKHFVDDHDSICSWVEPKAGTTAFIQFKSNGEPVNDVDFCMDLLEKTKVFFCPGSHCFGDDQDFAGYVRVGYVCQTQVLETGLKKLEGYIQSFLS
ncbi:hypothetical protein QQX98_007545 [Neonectria punicea]|uniref:Aminotransferase class I/classII large domain-containing protein n=1 Tax=Neonectria punicea TaxID=979145 RepID=A0ABR1GXP8_9HYPO